MSFTRRYTVQEVNNMVTVENVLRVLNYEQYDGISLLKRSIEAGVLVTVPYDGAFSSYNYAITRDSLYDFLIGLKFPEVKIEKIMENV